MNENTRQREPSGFAIGIDALAKGADDDVTLRAGCLAVEAADRDTLIHTLQDTAVIHPPCDGLIGAFITTHTPSVQQIQ